LRVYAEPDEQTLAELEKLALEKGISKRQLLMIAIDQLLHHKEPDRSEVDQARSEVDQFRSKSDQARGEAEALKRDQEHYKQTIEMKDKQIAFLEGHVAQLTQSISQLALPPSEEEIRAKHWWQFWR